MSTVAKSGLRPTNQQIHGKYTKSEEFLQECETYIELTEPTASDRRRIAFVLTYLKGPAPSRGKDSTLSSTTIDPTPLIDSKSNSMRLMVIQQKNQTPSPSSNRLYQGNDLWSNIYQTS